jgi:hypothetical protein
MTNKIYTYYDDNVDSYIDYTNWYEYVVFFRKENAHLLFLEINKKIDKHENDCLELLNELDVYILGKSKLTPYSYVNHILSYTLYTTLYSLKLFEINNIC